MARPVEAFLLALQRLLPPGLAWPRDPDANLTQVLAARAEGLAAVDQRADDLREEADPRTAYELLGDYERVCGLPGACLGTPESLAARRQVLVNKLTYQGGQSRAFFIALAEALGYAVTISEFAPLTCGGRCDGSVGGVEWRYTWRINAPQSTVRDMDCAGTCAERLRTWGNETLECAVSAKSPAHTNLLFAYA